ncbi:MAG: S9 family peptidase [Lentimicrobiaceae bacterium]|jgi:dipeptidyl-peptidase-4|nr:S9 family peptidase [Lentimicrobiaceae bacterium]
MKHSKSLLLLLSAFLLAFGFVAKSQESKITIDDIYTHPVFYPKMVYGMNPLKDGNTYAVIDDSLLNVYRYKTGEKIKTLLNLNTLVPEGKKHPIPVHSYMLNSDETKMLIPTETEAIYRRSSKSEYYLYDFKTIKLERLSPNGKQLFATFSPDGSMVAFVRENNIFVKSLSDGSEKQITFDGKTNEIINGVADWVYEEEFGFAKAFFWSPDSKKIAYYRFDESLVKEFQMEYFTGLYPEWYKFKYPKAGEDNSRIEIYAYDLASAKATKIDIGTETDIYVPRVKWTEDPNVLSLQRMNRLQNHLEILFADAATGATKVIYEEQNQYYIDVIDAILFLPENDFVINSEKDGYNHLYLYDKNGKLLRQLTQGNWDVTNIYGYSQVQKAVFYQSAEKTPLDRQIYKVDLKGKKKEIVGIAGTNNATFSTNFNYFINTNTTANTPHRITVNQADGKEIRVLEDNAAVVEKLKNYAISPKTFFTISHPDIVLPNGENVTLNAWKILPPDFDENKKYPVLFHVYSGPGSQTVQNAWGWNDYFWEQMLAQKGIIVVSVDNRGTGARGEIFKKMTYKELGKYETEDMISAAKYLAELPYIDAERIGIFGWSYGGFMATSAITKGADYFSTAVAVAPVTNWRYYDNIYTERFMQRPQENAAGYDDNSPINHVDKLKGNYLLVHGSADDNVHYQNTMELIKALVGADKQFELMIYPDKNHSIYGGNSRKHLFIMITNFLEKHLLN